MTTDPVAAIEVSELRKGYDTARGRAGKNALDGVDLRIPRGSIFGLLGPNGAGKSTLINIVAGLVAKSSGQVRVCGIDIDREPRRARLAVGVVPQELALDPYFPARAAIDLQGGLFGIAKADRRTDELLAALRLTDKADQPARSLSGGMRRRLMVAKALVHNPPVLMLDEPTAGVDVELRAQLWQYVRRLNHAGTTVLLTTHYLHEAEALCDRIAVLVNGRIVANDSTAALLSRLKDRVLEVEVDRPLASIPQQLRPFEPVIAEPRRLVMRYGHRDDNLDGFLSAVHAAGLRIVDVKTNQPALEDVFLTLIRGEGDVQSPMLQAGSI